MPEITVKALYNEAISFMKKTFPEGGGVQGCIDEADQEHFVKLFQPMLKHRMFYLVMDVANQEIVHQQGIFEHLGYKNLDLLQYFNIIPLPVLQMINHVATTAFDIIHSDQHSTNFMDKSLASDIPLRRSDGKYVLTRKNMYILDVCPKGRIIKHLNIYTVLKEIDENGAMIPLSPQVQSAQELSIASLENRLAKALKERFKKGKILQFPQAEKDVLEAVTEGMNNAAIAKLLKYKEGTIKTLKYRAIQRAKEYFGDKIPISTAEELVRFLKDNKIEI